MAKRIILIFLCIVFAILPFSFVAHAAVSAVSSPLHEPVSSITDNGSGYDYKVYFVAQYSDSGTLLYEMSFTLPYSAQIKLILKNYNQWFLWCSQRLNYTQTIYNVVDGYLSEQHDAVGQNDIVSPDPNLPYYMNARSGYFPARSVYNHTLLGAYYIIPEGLQVQTISNNFLVEPFVTWAPDLPYVHSYKSFVSEPVSDELNRYFVLAGEEEQYLYCIRYFLSEAVGIQTEFDIDPNNSFQYGLKNLFCPYIDINNNGLQLLIACDADLIELINQGNNNAAIAYDIQVSQYNLQDGQYIASYVFTDILLADDSIPLNIDFGDHTRFDSIQLWGVMYQDTSSLYHYNLLNCTWALDPDFIAWQDQVSNYLNLIYQALIESEEGITINDDMSAYDEMQSARNDLIVTDENGDPLDAASQVEVAFSEAASGMSQIGGGVSSINTLITSLISTHWIVIIPIFVALALGLIVTILGKNKSD